VGAFATPVFVAVSDAGEVIVSSNGGASWAFAANYTTTTNVLYTAVGNDDSRVIAGDSQLDLESIVAGEPKWQSQLGFLPGSAPFWTYFCSLSKTNLAG
jgi:hypothetical protein